MTRKCLWDESHTYKTNEGENYRHLCPTCYHNIYREKYSNKYQWHDFLKNIEAIKLEDKINKLEKELASCKQKLESFNNKNSTVEVECLFCSEAFKVDPKETWRYACTDCFKKFIVPLRQSYDLKTIKTLISAFKEEHGSEGFKLEDLISFAKEHFQKERDD